MVTTLKSKRNCPVDLIETKSTFPTFFPVSSANDCNNVEIPSLRLATEFSVLCINNFSEPQFTGETFKTATTAYKKLTVFKMMDEQELILCKKIHQKQLIKVA